MYLERTGPKETLVLLRFQPKYSTRPAVPPLIKFPYTRFVIDKNNDVHRYTIAGGKVYFQYLYNARPSDLCT